MPFILSICFIFYSLSCVLYLIFYCASYYNYEHYNKKMFLDTIAVKPCDLFLAAKYSVNVNISQSYLVCIYL